MEYLTPNRADPRPGNDQCVVVDRSRVGDQEGHQNPDYVPTLGDLVASTGVFDLEEADGALAATWELRGRLIELEHEVAVLRRRVLHDEGGRR